MNEIVILCNGAFPRKPYPLYLLETADAVVCCDNAFQKYLAHTRKRFGTERLPEVVIGDMDSLSPALRRQYPDLMLPVEEQDDNDMTKAMRYVLDRHPEVRSIHILGATGLREDHTLGNMALLMEYTRMFDLGEIRVEMVSDYGTSFAVTDSCELHVGKGRRVSLFSPDNGLVIRSEGLVWPTDGVVFDNWWKATLNRASEDIVRLTFSRPSMALVCLD